MSKVMDLHNLRKKTMAFLLGLTVSATALAQENKSKEFLPKQDNKEVKDKSFSLDANAMVIASAGATRDLNDQDRNKANYDPYADLITSVKLQYETGRLNFSLSNTDLVIMGADGKLTPLLAVLEATLKDTKSGLFLTVGQSNKEAGTTLYNGTPINEQYNDDMGMVRYGQKFNEIALGLQKGGLLIKLGAGQRTGNDWIIAPNLGDKEAMMFLAKVQADLIKSGNFNLKGSFFGAFNKDEKILQSTLTAKMPKTAISVTGKMDKTDTFTDWSLLANIAHEVKGMGNLMAQLDVGKDYQVAWFGVDGSKIIKDKTLSAMQFGVEYRNNNGNKTIGGRVTIPLNLGSKHYSTPKTRSGARGK